MLNIHDLLHLRRSFKNYVGTLKNSGKSSYGVHSAILFSNLGGNTKNVKIFKLDIYKFEEIMNKSCHLTFVNFDFKNLPFLAHSF